MSRDQANFYYNLAIMLDAGIPLLRTIEAARQSCSRRLSQTILKIAGLMAAGSSLPDAMKKFPNCFSHFDIVAVEAADQSGTLAEVLRLLSEWHQFSANIKGRIKAGLLFPVAALIIAAFVAPLPPYFLGVYTLSRALLETVQIISMFVVPAAIIYAIVRFMPKTGPLRAIFDLVALRVPILGKALKHYAISRYCYTFYILQKAGLPATDCTELALQSTTNAVVAERLKGGFLNAVKGRRIAEGFKKPFVDGFIEAWAMGEESGQLDIVAQKLADENKQASLFYFEQFAFWLPKFVYTLICLEIIYMIFRNMGTIGYR